MTKTEFLSLKVFFAGFFVKVYNITVFPLNNTQGTRQY